MLKKIIFQFLALSLIFTYSAQSAESGGMPQLNPEFWISQIFWLVLTFGLLFIILSKFILPKISNNLETRKSQILENIETADKQREETEKKVKEFDKIINDTKVEAKNFFNSERQKVLDDINNKRLSLEKDIEKLLSSLSKSFKCNNIFIIIVTFFYNIKIFNTIFPIIFIQIIIF